MEPSVCLPKAPLKVTRRNLALRVAKTSTPSPFSESSFKFDGILDHGLSASRFSLRLRILSALSSENPASNLAARLMIDESCRHLSEQYRRGLICNPPGGNRTSHNGLSQMI
jgi:hypothetical protein